MLYSFCTKSKERILHFLVQLHVLCWAETELWSVEGFRERSHCAAPKGNAKTLRQKDRIRTTLRKVRLWRTPKGQPEACGRKGISQVRTEAKGSRGLFVSFLFARLESLPFSVCFGAKRRADKSVPYYFLQEEQS